MKVASFAFTTPNLGDDLQVIAASMFLPRVDLLVDRDRMVEIDLPSPHFVVMNSWFQLGKRFLDLDFAWKRPLRAPSPSFLPLFHGFCVGRDKLLNRSWTPYLERHQPIGARDRVSVERLQARSIESYWSGCLTAFIGRKLTSVGRGDREGILIADVPEPVVEFYVPPEIRRRSRRVTTYPEEGILADPLARMHRIARLCDELRRAELVVTRRLHVALPCVSFGTPVVVIAEATPHTKRRFAGFDEFLPLTWYSGELRPARIDWDSREPARLPQELEGRFQQFLDRVKGAVGCLDDAPLIPAVAKSSEVRIENPGLGGNAGEVALDFGSCSVTRPASLWSPREIRFSLDAFASFPRFGVPVKARATGTAQWKSIGVISDLFKQGRTSGL